MFKKEYRNVFMPVTQAANFLNLSKEEVKKFGNQGILTKFEDNGYRYILSMRRYIESIRK